MLLTRTKKEQLVSEMKSNFENKTTILLINYQGLKVNEINDLKTKLAEVGIKFQVTKNTLFKIVLKKLNLEIDEKLLDQPIALVWGGKDEVISSKLVSEFKKKSENLKIVGGFIDNKFIDTEIIKQLASLPGREELYAKLVGSLNAPMYRLVNALQGNLRSLVYILDQYGKQK